MRLETKTPVWLLWGLAWVGLSMAHGASSPPSPESLRDGKVDELVQDRMRREHIPGLALAVVRDGKILKARGYGVADVASKSPVTTNTVFRIASVSKQFVATAIMMLVEAGKLGLDDPVSKYLEETPSAWKAITVRHLLTQTSGIPDFLNEDLGVDWGVYRSDGAVFKAVAARPLHFAPGEEFRYSNSNYHLLAMILRRITGQAYGDFLRERIFQPLGMTHTAVSPLQGHIPGLAVGYVLENGRLRPGDTVDPWIKAYAGGGIVSTVADMAKWDAALYSEKLLKHSSLEQMWSPVRLKDGMKAKYGFGWGTTGRSGGQHLVVSHAGNFTGFSSSIYRAVDDRVTVIVLDNRHDSAEAAGWLSQKIARLYVWNGPDYQPIADREPAVTAHVRDIIEQAGSGKLQRADFTAAEWAEWEPWQKQAQLDKAISGPPLSLVLVERKQENGSRSYRYRVEFKLATVLLHVVVDEENRIAGWTGEDVDLK